MVIVVIVVVIVIIVVIIVMVIVVVPTRQTSPVQDDVCTSLQLQGKCPSKLTTMIVGSFALHGTHVVPIPSQLDVRTRPSGYGKALNLRRSRVIMVLYMLLHGHGMVMSSQQWTTKTSSSITGRPLVYSVPLDACIRVSLLHIWRFHMVGVYLCHTSRRGLWKYTMTISQL